MASCAASFSSAQDYVPHQLLVKFTDGTSPAAVKAVLDSVGGRIEKQLPQIGVQIVSLPASANEGAVSQRHRMTRGLVINGTLAESRHR
jgi:hypothetical protein